ncbi:MAG TPA: DUF2231 domain-containing protein [Candidatus Binataceae bacterium]|nr:DUF2231 domain-containing protein [Candidatus Binataceae bacterium]
MPAHLWQLLDFRGVDALQNLHPLIVHYPIALLTACIPIYFLAWVLRRESLEFVGLWLLGLGALGAIAAAYTGLLGSEGVMIAPSVRANILVYHKSLMLTVLGLSVVLAGWAIIARPMPRRFRTVFMIGLVVMGLVLAKGADYGGWMVYGYNAGGSLPQPIEFSQ